MEKGERMKPYKQLLEEKLISVNSSYSHSYVIKFYREQLEKFYKIGMSKLTENGVKITPGLIEVTEKRLNQLQPTINRGKG